MTSLDSPAPNFVTVGGAGSQPVLVRLSAMWVGATAWKRYWAAFGDPAAG
jgi:hypothetical protein